jgi:hypothetical protein
MLHRTPFLSRSMLAVALPATLVALAGCGGGDDLGASADAVATAAPTAATAITADSAASVVRRAYSVSRAVYAAGAAATAQLEGVAMPRTGAAADLSASATRGGPALAGIAAGGPAAKAVSTTSRACPSGGAVAARWDDADNSLDLTSGDSGSLVFGQCAIREVTLDGGFSFTGLSLGGPSGTGRTFGMTVAFDALRTTEGASSTAVTGDLSVQAVLTEAPSRVLDLILSGAGLAVTDAAGTDTLSGYSARAVVDDTGDTYGFTLTGTASGTGLPGDVTVSTPVPLIGAIGADPSSGQLVATSSDGRSARLTALSAQEVSVEVDEDANGTYESSRRMTWDEFRAS